MKRRRISPLQEATSHVLACSDRPGLHAKWISTSKGRGVFSRVHFEADQFVLEYRGDLISEEEYLRRQEVYGQDFLVYLFELQYSGKRWCIDASRDDGSLGRLVNDDNQKPNCKMKKLVINGKPHLCLFAIREILPDEEVTYNYGIHDWPWRKKPENCDTKANVPQPKTPEISDSTVTVLQLKIPEHCDPSVNVPPPQTPEISESSVTVLQLKIPEHCDPSVNVPQLQTPEISDSTVTVLQLKIPEHCDPSVNVPSPQTPEISDSTVTVLQLKIPEHCDPSVNVPSPQTPEISESSVTVLQLKIPEHCDPSVNVPQLQTPEISDSTVTVLQLKIPEHCDPSVNVPPPQTPEISDSTVTVLQLKIPEHCDPSVNVPPPQTPEISDSTVTVLQLKRPEHCDPSVNVPQLQTPEISDSTVTVLQLKIPDHCDPSVNVPQPQLNKKLLSFEDVSKPSTIPLNLQSQVQDPFDREDEDPFPSRCPRKAFSKKPIFLESEDEPKMKQSRICTRPKPSQSSQNLNCHPFEDHDLPLSSSEYSEDEYVPDTEESSDSSSPWQTPKKFPQKSKYLLIQPQSHSRNSSPISGLSNSDSVQLFGEQKPSHISTSSHLGSSPVSRTQSPDLEVNKVYVLSTGNGKKKNFKRQHCLYCKKLYCKIARHFEQVHKNEVDVAKALNFPKKSKERKLHLEFLRNKGNRVHNHNVMKSGTGVLIPFKVPSGSKADPNGFLHCKFCHGFFSRQYLWKHLKSCRLAIKGDNLRPGRNRVQAYCTLSEPVPDDVSQRMWKILSVMNPDKVTSAIKSDSCLLKFGNYLCNKMGHDENKHGYIRQKLREVGRLLVHGRQTATTLSRMVDYINPINFPAVIIAVKGVAGYKEDTGSYSIPSLAIKLGHSLHKLAGIIEADALIVGDENNLKNAQDFKKIQETRWNECISSHAYTTLSDNKMNKPLLLPFTEDVQKLHLYLKGKQCEYIKTLSSNPSPKNWTNLSKVTLAQVIVFNRRRAGEVAKMPLKAFTMRDSSGLHENVADALSELERKLCNHFIRLEIHGKRGRKVPILATPAMLQAMQCLVQYRSSSGISDSNVYMFARPHSNSHLRGCECIRILAHESGVKNPHTLTSTKLRKHVATMSKVLNLKENEMHQLAEFMGHDLAIHKEFYRLPEGTLQTAKLSKIFMALQHGNLSLFNGKSLDEMEIDPDETFHDESVVSSDKESNHEESSQDEMKGATEKRKCPENPLPQDAMSSSQVSSCSSIPKAGRPLKGEGPMTKRRRWQEDEVRAVEKHLKKFIHSCTVPGKLACLNCITSEPDALKHRDWLAVKYYVNNCIASQLRKEQRD